MDTERFCWSFTEKYYTCRLKDDPKERRFSFFVPDSIFSPINIYFSENGSSPRLVKKIEPPDGVYEMRREPASVEEAIKYVEFNLYNLQSKENKNER